MQHMPAGLLPVETRQPPILDLAVFHELADVLGWERMLRMSDTFFADADRRLASLAGDDASTAELGDHVHALISMAGHFGLRHLSALCTDMQELARCGRGLDQRPVLEAAVEEARRAVDAAVAEGAPGRPSTATHPGHAPGVGRDGFPAAGTRSDRRYA